MSRVWRRFVLHLVVAALGGSLALFLLLALLDPWGTLPFPSPLPRLPADHSQRWAYPELARDRRFDAAIIGNSTARLLDPGDLDPAAGARFVNLAMVSGAAFEQARLLDVFIAAHPAPSAVLIALERRWCEYGDDLPRFGFDPIPDWLYDNDPIGRWTNLLNLHAIDTAARSLAAILGAAPRPYGDNGYALIDVDRRPYDPERARAMLAQSLAEPWPAPSGPDPAAWRYPALDWLVQRLDRLPPGTRKLLVFVPLHHLYPAPGSVGAAMFAECKRRVVDIAHRHTNAEVYDMAIPSPITLDGASWWDAVHTRPDTAADVSRTLADAIRGRTGPLVRALVPAAAASVSVR